MATRKKVDLSLLSGLVQESQTQEAQKGNQRTTDPNFPFFKTPVDDDILVYFPKTNLRETENGFVMDTLKSFIHSAKANKQFSSIRCIHGMSGNPAFEALGYDGECPACEAMTEVWELFNLKLDAEAKRQGIDRNNDPDDVLKPFRMKLLDEMAIKAAEEFITFPVVIIPTQKGGGNYNLTEDALEKLEPTFVHWRKSRYDDKILGALASLINNPGHPAGTVFTWKFTYDTKGKEANARDAAKSAKYTIVQDAGFLQQLEEAGIFAKAEEKAQEFTPIKAAEVITDVQFSYKEDLQKEVDKVMTATRQQLSMFKANSAVTGIEAPAGQGALGAGNPLANFGVAGEGQPQAQPQGEASQGEAPQGEGQPQVTGGQPFKFE